MRIMFVDVNSIGDLRGFLNPLFRSLARGTGREHSLSKNPSLVLLTSWISYQAKQIDGEINNTAILNLNSKQLIKLICNVCFSTAFLTW